MRNSGLKRVNTGMFDKGKEQAQRSARANLEVILTNKKWLLKVRNGARLLEAAESMNRQKEDFTPNQMSYIEGIYEKTMSGAGFDSCNLYIDRKRKGLRYG